MAPNQYRIYSVFLELYQSKGDGNNDVEMLNWAGLGVAMSDARPSAKAAAAIVASPGDPKTSLARAAAAVLRQ